MSSVWADFGRDLLPTPSPSADVKNLRLGEFPEERAVAKQEQNVDSANQELSDSASNAPTTFQQAMKSPESKEWKAAIHTELENLRRKSVWTVKRLPKARKALSARWVFAKKPNADGSTKFKACYVAKGFNQKEGTDYAHTFAPTPRSPQCAYFSP
jgi:hypothetical protein